MKPLSESPVELPHGSLPVAAQSPPRSMSSSRTTTILEVRVVTGAGGGPDKTILNTPRLLDPLGYRTICAFMHPPGDPGFEVIRRRATRSGARLESIPDRGPFDLSVVRNLTQLCQQENVSIWHGHDYKSNLLGVWIRRRWPMRLVSTVHGWVDRHWKAPLYDRLDRWSLNSYQRVICVSDDLRATCARSGIKSERLHVIENGIDVEQFQRRRSTTEARQAIGWPTDGICIGAIGRLSAEKGFDVLIEAVHQLRHEFPQLRLVIAGDGPLHQTLAEQIQRLQLEGVVRLLGFCEDVPALLESLDAFVLSSRREGLPNVVLEAMAMGLPIVATSVAGIPRIIDDGSNGLLVPADDRAALAAAVRRCITDEELRRRLGAAARNAAVQRHSFAVRTQRLHEVYQDLLSAPAGGLA